MTTVPTSVIFIAVIVMFCSYKYSTNIPLKKGKGDISRIYVYQKSTAFSGIFLLNSHGESKAIDESRGHPLMPWRLGCCGDLRLIPPHKLKSVICEKRTSHVGGRYQ